MRAQSKPCATLRRRIGRRRVLLRAESLTKATGIALLKAFAPSRSKNNSAPLVASFSGALFFGHFRPSLSSLIPAGTRGAGFKNSSRFCAEMFFVTKRD